MGFTYFRLKSDSPAFYVLYAAGTADGGNQQAEAFRLGLRFPCSGSPALEVFILCPDKLSVLVPYEDLVELLSLKDKFKVIEKEHK